MNMNKKDRTKITIINTLLLIMTMTFRAYPVWADTSQIILEVSVPLEDTTGAGITKAYNRLVLGVHPEATGNYDPQWDTPAFFSTPDPENPPLLRAYFEHPEYASNQKELWRDIRSDTGGSQKTWDMAVVLAPSEIGKAITLSWALSPSLLTSKDKITLLDQNSQSSIDMRRQSSYSFVNGSSSPKMLSVTINSSKGSSSSGSGNFGCGTVKRDDFNKPGTGTTIPILINLLILLSPVLLRLRPLRSNSTN
ncbi:MAG: hypothetical protein HZA12_06105 [Nitrospirae bacterium]|nr:hypothetical protein [Nitrospirota bacterium]